MPSEDPKRTKSSADGAVQFPSFSKGIELLSKFVAPPTLLTALLFYFGYIRIYIQYSYFGINPNILGLSSKDYLLQSVAVVGFDSLRIFLVAILIASWGYFVIEKVFDFLQKNDKRIGYWSLLILLILMGLALVMGIVERLDAQQMLYRYNYRLSWTVGIVLVGYGLKRISNSFGKKSKKRNAVSKLVNSIPNWLRKLSFWCLVGLFIFGLFWTVADYGAVLGDWMAEQIALGNRRVSCAFIYSRTPLNITHPSVETEKISEDENAFQYAYYGLRLLTRANDRYFLIPVGWSAEDSRAIILDDSENIRIELGPDDFECLPK